MALLHLAPLLVLAPQSAPSDTRPPNIVLILADDLGYGDLSCAGHPTLHTPRVDAMAQEGTQFTQAYAGASVCTPSRATLLTGCDPRRVGLHERVVFPPDAHGLHPDEVTMAEVLRTAGYATGCVGKWHLGHRAGMLPLDQGFDTWFGWPYSNDMSRVHRTDGDRYEFHLPIFKDRTLIEWEPDQRFLTQRLTQAAVEFIDANAARPFFLYVAHAMPHVPLYVSPQHAGQAPRGLYGDVVQELDWSVGRILDTLDAHDLARNTLVLFTSDNGPWTTEGNAGGSAEPLRGGKGTHWEGGYRVPFIARWPGVVPAGGHSAEVVTFADVLPTVAAFARARVEPRGSIDGRDVSGSSEAARAAAAEVLYRDRNGAPRALRHGPWKLVLGVGERQDQLYHLEHDIGEARDVAQLVPALVDELRARAQFRFAEVDAAARTAGRSDEAMFDPRSRTPAVAPGGPRPGGSTSAPGGVPSPSDGTWR